MLFYVVLCDIAAAQHVQAVFFEILRELNSPSRKGQEVHCPGNGFLWFNRLAKLRSDQLNKGFWISRAKVPSNGELFGNCEKVFCGEINRRVQFQNFGYSSIIEFNLQV